MSFSDIVDLILVEDTALPMSESTFILLILVRNKGYKPILVCNAKPATSCIGGDTPAWFIMEIGIIVFLKSAIKYA